MLTMKKTFGLFILFVGLSLFMYSISPGQKLAEVDANNRAATLSGTVVDAVNQSPIAGVTVKLPLANKQAKTDKDGKFVFQDLSNGTYEINIDHSGFKSYTKSVNIQDQNKRMEIKLEPASQGEK